jgi:hypothetical protein
MQHNVTPAAFPLRRQMLVLKTVFDGTKLRLAVCPSPNHNG